MALLKARAVPFLTLLLLLPGRGAPAQGGGGSTNPGGATGDPAWLHYRRLEGPSLAAMREALPRAVAVLGDSPVLEAGRRELVTGLSLLLDRSTASTAFEGSSAIVLGTVDSLRKEVPSLSKGELGEEAYRLKTTTHRGKTILVIAGGSDRGALYGAFALLRMIALGKARFPMDEESSPRARVRWVNEWDNLDGTIERGYAGPSLFFEGGHVTKDLSRVKGYARLLASLGVNGCAVNNVNADMRALSGELLQELGTVAEIFRPWGIRLALAIDFSSPKGLGGLKTFDPLDPDVAEFWRQKVDEVYRRIPDLGGFVLKADSEGRLGPAAYGRTHADAANVIARALRPKGGILFYRGFVYNHHLDWREPKNDRAKAAYDNFSQLDGLFDDNVVLQIKNGPIDFQVREPPSPLFSALERTNQAIELQITQEYTGQQRHLVFLVPMWKSVLDFDMGAGEGATPVKDLVSGRTFGRPLGGFVGVSNVGRDPSWLSHPLALANLYGFGRLAFNPDLDSKTIADEWTRLTFGDDPKVDETVEDMELASWRAYEGYTGPLGAGTLTDILGPHYGPGIESSEKNGWGQWHRADHDGIGMDRTEATGTGFISQYRPRVAQGFESLERCPDELLLFMHHVPYTHVLHSGKTVIQQIYDSHYEGAETVSAFVGAWRSLKGRLDAALYEDVLKRLEYQEGHAVVWRDAICSWFLRTSGIADIRGRAGNFPGRVVAEAMTLDGYEPIEVTPMETASLGKAVECRASTARCSARFTFGGEGGRHDVTVCYFDLNTGASRFTLLAGGRVVDRWVADLSLPSGSPNGHTAVRRTLRGVELRKGDTIEVDSDADRDEKAPLDYVEVGPPLP